MGKPIAHLGSYHVCPDKTSKKKHEGGPVFEAASSVFTGGMPVTCVGDSLVCKGPPDTIAEGSASVFVEGRRVARVGDATAHGGKIVVGNPTVLVGDQVSVGTGAAAASISSSALGSPGNSDGEALRAEAVGQPADTTHSDVSSRGNGGAATPVANQGSEPALQRAAGPETVTEKPKQDKRVLRIGVFFDGTGNRKDNDRYLSDRDITNVVKLHDLYEVDKEYVERIYIPGVGTIGGEMTENGFEAPEDLFGLATGIGPNGGHDRVELAVTLVRETVADYPADEVVFDVFGFSRGASLARHFVNLINLWPETIGIPTLRSRFWGARPVVYMNEVVAFPQEVKAKVAFVGLFDTVGSFYLAGNEANLDFDLYLPGSCADRVVQLTAHHEIRRNFPLTSIKGPDGGAPGHFTEVVLPGVHSDIGGGYENPGKNFENYEIFDLRAYTGHGTNWRTVQAAQKEIEAWNNRDPRNIQPDVRGPDVYAVERRPTRKELAIFVLHNMYEYASSAGVPLRAMDRNQEEHRIPMDLQMALDDWKAAGASLDQARRYFGDYIHTSHREGSLPYGPTASGERVVYPNWPAGSKRPNEAPTDRSLELDWGWN